MEQANDDTSGWLFDFLVFVTFTILNIKHTAVYIIRSLYCAMCHTRLHVDASRLMAVTSLRGMPTSAITHRCRVLSCATGNERYRHVRDATQSRLCGLVSCKYALTSVGEGIECRNICVNTESNPTQDDVVDKGIVPG